MNRPNILYIHSHDTGRFVQPYGHAIPTPHLQQLAEEGVLFRQAFCAAPTCSPSRAALLTGQAAHSSGMLGLAHRGFGLKDMRQHLIHTLHEAGYTSALAGMQHVADDASKIGYHQILPTETRHAADVVPAATAFLHNAPTQPFFLNVGFFETHREFPGTEVDSRYTLPAPGLPDTPATRWDMADYKASAQILDEGIGAVLAALDQAGLRENTLVIVTTDHGIAFPGHKCNLTDRGIGVMLIMRGPGEFSGGRVVDALISHVDIFPTLCDLLQIEPPAWLQGYSLLPLLRGEQKQIRDELFAEVTYHAAYEPQRCVRTERWKYIVRYHEPYTPVLPNCDDSPSKDAWLQAGWAKRPLPEEALYDLTLDPAEINNLYDSTEHIDVINEMRSRLDQWMHATGDPLLDGPVPAPSGARVNDPLGLSPRETPLIMP